MFIIFFFFNDTATTEIYTLSLHDALPIFIYNVGEHATVTRGSAGKQQLARKFRVTSRGSRGESRVPSTSTPPFLRSSRSEEHTSELQSRQYLVCRLLLEKKQNLGHPSLSP